MKKACKFLIQLIILIVIYQVGNLTVKYLHLQIPGNVLGIVVLLVLLWSGLIKVEQIEWAAGWLLKHLGFFFIPISVGLMTLGDIFKTKGWILLVILFISAILGIIAAGKTTQAVITKNQKENVNYHDHAL
ncbi:murein hydrolase regulator LrgA [Bacillus sp. AFS076308]|uniref:CidA/LrgA family protein n=1 Tax=unclassified Bacillus (in: firmicutes) TaxID=185979 RepID=UPI000BF5D905|nr:MULTISPECIES: CidA/LrgA family protein [unclassified Bacillus (in: firmicutes)]PFO04809.1 murein hydrolase regulator LrgA [Bacillus sp. AFS076308]PGV49749.1 murein hydrolase regulator LrgA [Bacillus sp. AFS037270]